LSVSFSSSGLLRTAKPTIKSHKTAASRRIHAPLVPLVCICHANNQVPTPGLAAAARPLLVAGLSLAASTSLLLAPLPSQADIQYVPASQITEKARPLTLQQPVDKKTVWTLFIGGAIVLFGTTVVLENNASLFPAIARANKAMRLTGTASQLQQQQQQQEEEEVYTGVSQTVSPAAPESLPGSGDPLGEDTSFAAVVSGIKAASVASEEAEAKTKATKSTEEPAVHAESSEEFEANVPQVLEGGAPVPSASSTPAEPTPAVEKDTADAADAAISLDRLEAALAQRLAEKQAADVAATAQAEPSLESLEAELQARLQAAEKAAPPESASSNDTAAGSNTTKK